MLKSFSLTPSPPIPRTRPRTDGSVTRTMAIAAPMQASCQASFAKVRFHRHPEITLADGGGNWRHSLEGSGAPARQRTREDPHIGAAFFAPPFAAEAVPPLPIPRSWVSNREEVDPGQSGGPTQSSWLRVSAMRSPRGDQAAPVFSPGWLERRSARGGPPCPGLTPA